MYEIQDCIDEAFSSLDWEKKYQYLMKQHYEFMKAACGGVYPSEFYRILKNRWQDLHEDVLEQGYEWEMFRWRDAILEDRWYNDASLFGPLEETIMADTNFMRYVIRWFMKEDIEKYKGFSTLQGRYR